MLEGLLALAVVIKTEFVHRAVADRPIVRNVPLLEALRDNTAEAGNIGTGELEVGERLHRPVVVEVVIDTKILLVINLVVELHCQLVAAYGLGRNGSDQIVIARGLRNELEQINRRRIHASEWNLSGGEDRQK